MLLSAPSCHVWRALEGDSDAFFSRDSRRNPKMDCTHAQSLLDTYLDDELDPVRSLEIDEHLRGCARCAQSYSDGQLLHKALKTESLYFKAPADLHKRIQRSLRQAARAETPSRWFSPSWI